MSTSIKIYCGFLCKRETAHEQIGEHKFRCSICGAEIEEVYCHACSKAGGGEMPIYHFPPACASVSENPQDKGRESKGN